MFRNKKTIIFALASNASALRTSLSNGLPGLDIKDDVLEPIENELNGIGEEILDGAGNLDEAIENGLNGIDEEIDVPELLDQAWRESVSDMNEAFKTGRIIEEGVKDGAKAVDEDFKIVGDNIEEGFKDSAKEVDEAFKKGADVIEEEV